MIATIKINNSLIMKVVFTLLILLYVCNIFGQTNQIIAVPTIYLNRDRGFPSLTEKNYNDIIDSTVLDLSYWYVKNGLVPKSWDNMIYTLKSNQPIIFIKVSELSQHDSLYLFSTITRRFLEKPWDSLIKKNGYSNLKPYFDSVYLVNSKPPRGHGGDAFDELGKELWLENFNSKRLLKETSNYLSIPCSFKSTPQGGKIYLLPTLFLSQSHILNELDKLQDGQLSYQILNKLIPNLNAFLIPNNTPIEGLYLPEFEYQLIFERNNKFQKKLFTPQMGNGANNSINF
jgi:hypothetical protein